MENQKAIEVSVRINLMDLNQVNAYHKLLLAIGGHATDEPVLSLSHQVLTPGVVEGMGGPNELIGSAPEMLFAKPETVEENETPKRSRSKKEVKTPTEAEAPTEAPTAEGMGVDQFRAKVAYLAMTGPDGIKRRNELKAWLVEKFGAFNAEVLDAQQRAEAFSWMQAAYTDLTFPA